MQRARSTARPREVALLIETSKSYGRGLIHGIGQYVREHGPWSLSFEPRDLFTSAPSWLRGWRGHGIIARLSSPALARAVLRLGLPVVNLSSALPDLDVPRLEANTDSIAQAAYRHLLERGFRHFAFLGDEVSFPVWSGRVGESFARVVVEAGHTCTFYRPPRRAAPHPARDRAQAALGRWIAGLAKPAGILVINDSMGQRLLDACRRVGALVPDQVAVLANENDDLVCSMATPPLSSLFTDAEKIGYEAAALLDAMMAGAAPTKKVVTFEPIGVAVRQSTDVQAHTDPVVARAVRFIRENAGDGIRVGAVQAAAGVSRTNLDARFRAAIGRTPHDEIVRVQLQRAMDLLANTTLKTLAVAQKAGFRHVEYMGVVFRKKVGLTPGEYRRRMASRVDAMSRSAALLKRV